MLQEDIICYDFFSVSRPDGFGPFLPAIFFILLVMMFVLQLIKNFKLVPFFLIGILVLILLYFLKIPNLLFNNIILFVWLNVNLI